MTSLTNPKKRFTHTLQALYEWDPAKAKSNQEEHGVDFADAVQVFDNPYLNKEDTDERPCKSSALSASDNLERVLVVVYTYRKDRIRLISRSGKLPKKKEKNMLAPTTISVIRISRSVPPQDPKRKDYYPYRHQNLKLVSGLENYGS